MWEKILSGILKDLLAKFGEWVLSVWKKNKEIKKEQTKNKEAVEKVKNAKTKEEIDNALDAISDRTSDK
jgi:hypothetical protein